MPTKAEAYRELADRATGNLTAQATDWIRFLLVAGKFYKYRFLDQVMIYTQRPDAKACAGYDLWKERMNRQVRYVQALRRGAGRHLRPHRQAAVPQGGYRYCRLRDHQQKRLLRRRRGQW